MAPQRIKPDTRTSLAIGTWVVLTLLALIVASRRLAGAFSAQIPMSTALLVAGVVGGLSLMAALLSRSGRRRHRDGVTWAVSAVTLTPPLLAGLALIPSGSTLGHSALATLLAFGAAAVWIADGSSGFAAQQPGDTGSFSISGSLDSQLSQQIRESASLDTDDAAGVLPSSDLPVQDELDEQVEEEAGISQWMTRRQLEDDQELIEGAATALFQPGQKQVAIHLAFCPPLAQTPEVHCEITSGDAARVRVTTAQTYGARLDVRLTSPAELEQTVRVSFSATCRLSQSDAA